MHIAGIQVQRMYKGHPLNLIARLRCDSRTNLLHFDVQVIVYVLPESVDVFAKPNGSMRLDWLGGEQAAGIVGVARQQHSREPGQRGGIQPREEVLVDLADAHFVRPHVTLAALTGIEEKAHGIE